MTTPLSRFAFISFMIRFCLLLFANWLCTVVVLCISNAFSIRFWAHIPIEFTSEMCPRVDFGLIFLFFRLALHFSWLYSQHVFVCLSVSCMWIRFHSPTRPTHRCDSDQFKHTANKKIVYSEHKLDLWWFASLLLVSCFVIFLFHTWHTEPWFALLLPFRHNLLRFQFQFAFGHWFASFLGYWYLFYLN